MPKGVTWRSGLLSVLFWSIIAAAFIGPGTVATAASAGAGYGFDLVWALAFSVFATAVLQEAAARLTLASGKNLGQIVALSHRDGRRRWISLLLFVAVAFGCAAYQAGNLLGALAGISFFSPLPRSLFTIGLAGLAAILLWIGRFRTIAHALGLVVAGMGAAFLYVALMADTAGWGAMLAGFAPALPAGSGLVVLGLVGTTIVPYNLFLASGLSRGQSMAEMRTGIWIAVLIGGLISMAILVVGSTVTGRFDFDQLAAALAGQLGSWAIAFFGLGLFAAGFTSSITAPLAAAITGSTLLGDGRPAWEARGRKFRYTWATILAVGAVFGVLDLQPIPVIILAQAINGLLLPVVALFLFFAINDRELIPEEYTNGAGANALMLLITGLACFLGLLNVWKAVLRLFPQAEDPLAYWVIGILCLLLLAWAGRGVFGRAKK